MRQTTPFAPGAKVGLTTTIPVEVVLAAGLTPVDLNNLFIVDPGARARVARPKPPASPAPSAPGSRGFTPPCRTIPRFAAVIVACQGDCSYTQALGEILEAEGQEVVHFKFPYPRNREQLAREIHTLMARLGADPDGVARVQARLAPLRQQLRRLDRLTWETGQVSGEENFLCLISSSDFASDLAAYEQR